MTLGIEISERRTEVDCLGHCANVTRSFENAINIFFLLRFDNFIEVTVTKTQEHLENQKMYNDGVMVLKLTAEERKNHCKAKLATSSQ